MRADLSAEQSFKPTDEEHRSLRGSSNGRKRRNLSVHHGLSEGRLSPIADI
jgi:hypothetical protein